MKILHDFTPAGDEYFKLNGYVQLPESADPVNPGINGFAFFLTDALLHNVLIGRQLPPGADRWKLSINNRLWSYSDPTGSVGGVTKVKIITIPLKGPNYYKVTIMAPKGDFLLPASKLPVNVVFAMDGSTQIIGDGLCATQVFSPMGGPLPACKTIGSSLTCR